MRSLPFLLGSILALLAGTAEPPIRGSLDDLRSDAVYLLDQSDGVARVEQLVAVERPRHRIIQIADLHYVPFDDFAADIRDQQGDSVTDDEIRQAYFDCLGEVRRVQEGQRKLLRWLGKYHGVNRVHLEGLADADLEAYRFVIHCLGRDGSKRLPPQFGAVAQAWLASDIEEVLPAEDEGPFLDANPFATEKIVFGGPANDRRERAIVRRLVASGPLSVIVLGGLHDLSQHARDIGGVEYLRVFVEGFPEGE